ncbi:unnamed protein product [Linum trigynum]|uniref:Secreted protein n=1 Tax=Linum trigynum TaxID=586398 RepID=A0AAV2CQB8_9ROSI
MLCFNFQPSRRRRRFKSKATRSLCLALLCSSLAYEEEDEIDKEGAEVMAATGKAVAGISSAAVDERGGQTRRRER